MGEVVRRKWRAWPPPMLWPIRKRGFVVVVPSGLGVMSLGAMERMKLRMSERTWGVGPVRPASEGWWTERPQPRWSKPWTARE